MITSCIILIDCQLIIMRLLTPIKRFTHTLEPFIDANTYRRRQIFDQLKQQTFPPLAGHYNLDGFTQYVKLNPNTPYKRLVSDPALQVSAIGVGTYKGSLDEKDDLAQFNGLVDSMNSGCNVVDSCRNFRGGRSEQIVGMALRHLITEEGYTRNSFMLGSKVGYVRNNLPKNVSPDQVLNGHCVHPQFLASELSLSLNNFGVETLDVYYLNNFSECHQGIVSADIFNKRLANAMEFLEKARSDGKIRYYGLSSWEAFRVPKGHKSRINLEEVLKVAEKVGGKNHGCRFVQLPINIMMPEAFADKYQEGQSFLDTAEQLKINVISSSPLLSGTLINIPMPASLLKCNSNGAKHLQLIRSIPAKALVSTLVGHKTNRHVRKNLQVTTVDALDEEEWLSVFVPSSSPENKMAQEIGVA